MPATWRRSVAVLLELIDGLERQLQPIEAELRPLARADRRVQMLSAIPGSPRCSA